MRLIENAPEGVTGERRFSMRSFLRTAFLFGALALALPVAAAPPGGAPPPARRVTLHYQAVPFRQAIAELFQGTGERYLVAPDVPNVPITLDLKDAPFMTALHALLKPAGARYRIEASGTQPRVWVMVGGTPAPPRAATPASEPIMATLEPPTAVLELVVPAALKPQVRIVAERATHPAAAGRTQVSGDVMVSLPGGVSLKIHQAQVKIVDAGQGGQRRVLITPLPALAVAR
jgi:hypothetical protein